MSNDQGVFCDSLILLSTHFVPDISNELDITICEGEDYEGLTEIGVYEYTFDAVFGCDSIVTINLEVLPSTDINCMPTSTDDLSEIEFEIYPNPAHETLCFIRGNEFQSFTFDVFDPSGKRVLSNNVTPEIDCVEGINLLVQGVYVIKIRKDQSVLTRMLIKI